MVETFNEEDEPYGIERLQEFLIKNRHEDLKRIHQKIILELDEFKGSIDFGDDITILSCRVEELQCK